MKLIAITRNSDRITCLKKVAKPVDQILTGI